MFYGYKAKMLSENIAKAEILLSSCFQIKVVDYLQKTTPLQNAPNSDIDSNLIIAS